MFGLPIIFIMFVTSKPNFFFLSSFLSKNTWAFFVVSFICDYIGSLIFSLWDLIDSWKFYILIEQRKVRNFVTYLGLEYLTVRINYYYYYYLKYWYMNITKELNAMHTKVQFFLECDSDGDRVEVLVAMSKVILDFLIDHNILKHLMV